LFEFSCRHIRATLTISATPKSKMTSLAQAFWASLECRVGHGRLPFYRALGYVVALAISGTASMWWVVDSLNDVETKRIQLLKEKVSELDKRVIKVNEIRKEIDLLLEREKFIEKLKSKNNDTLRDLGNISEIFSSQSVACPRCIHWNIDKRFWYGSGGEESYSKTEYYSALPFRQTYLVEMSVVDENIVVRGETYSIESIADSMRNTLNFENVIYWFSLRSIESFRESRNRSENSFLPPLHTFEIEFRRRNAVGWNVAPINAQSTAPAKSATQSPSQIGPPEDLESVLSSYWAIGSALSGCLVLFAGWYCRKRWWVRVRTGSQRVLGQCMHSMRMVDHRNLNSWPLMVRLIVLAEVLVLVLGVLFVNLIVPRIETVTLGELEEVDLRGQFKKKLGQSVNLELYERQKNDLSERFANVSAQLLLNTANQDALLSELALLAERRNLKVEWVHPIDKIQRRDFYVVTSRAMGLVGSFENLSAFIADIRDLRPIAAMPKYRLSALPIRGNEAQRLMLDATIESYRLMLPEETAEYARFIEAKKSDDAQRASK
jgi:type IV pilus assembly protein PilO